MPNVLERDPTDVLTSVGLRLDTDVAPFGTRRPDQWSGPVLTAGGVRAVAKVYPRGGGRKAWENLSAVWASSFGERRGLSGVPRPLAFHEVNEGGGVGDGGDDGDSGEGWGVLVMERLDGRPLAELRVSGGCFEPAIRLLAELHASDAVVDDKRGSRAVVRSMERKVDRIAELAPEHAALARDVAAGLAAGRVKERELVPSHGDFSPRNVLVCTGVGAGADGSGGVGLATVGAPRLVLMDWDRLQRADPARDVAYFATYGWADALRRGRMPGRDDVRRAVEIYEAARPGVRLGKSLRFHLAAGCVRRAASVLELWPAQSWLAPAWLQMARRELEAMSA
jgi:thiamine kinase-like enzyme